MLRFPNEPLPGQPISAGDHAAVVRAVKSIAPRSTPGSLVRVGSGGQTQRPIARPRPFAWPLSPASPFVPFQVINFIPTTTDGTTTYAATFQPGVVNGNLFPLINMTAMWQLVATTTGGVTSYAWPTLTVNKGDYVYLEATIVAGAITQVILTNGSTDPATLETDDLTTYLIGTCDTHTGAFTQVSTGNRTLEVAAAYFNGGSRLLAFLWS